MESTTLSKIAELAGAQILQGPADRGITSVSTDSRTIKPGELFVALKGDNFDGHSFLPQVANRGAAGAIISQSEQVHFPAQFALLRVPDTLRAYQDLAAGYRKLLAAKVLCITGSNGKTSTKDFAASILGRNHRVTKTEGNFNNHVGLPRTILKANRSDEMAVWEIGMNHPGEIAALSRIASPSAAIITNIGMAHIEFMGSREAIAREKGALAEAVSGNGFVVLNADDPFTEEISRRTRARVILAGVDKGWIRAVEVQQTRAGSEFTILEGAHRCRAHLPVAGLHMVQNATLAVAAGRALGVSLEDCAAGLGSTPLTKARLQIREINGVRFIDDTYNANPDSMKAALRTLMELESDGQRIAVLGKMLELGTESDQGHWEVGESAAVLGVDFLIGLGDDAIVRGAQQAGLDRSIVAQDASEAARKLTEIASAGDLVLVKGSRSARTELVLEEFARLEPATEENHR